MLYNKLKLGIKMKRLNEAAHLGKFIKAILKKLMGKRGLSKQEKLAEIWPQVQNYRGVLMDKYGMEPEDALDEIVEALSEHIPDLEVDDVYDMLDDMDDADMYESAELARMKDLAGLK